jgi:hypothetical protein
MAIIFKILGIQLLALLFAGCTNNIEKDVADVADSAGKLTGRLSSIIRSHDISSNYYYSKKWPILINKRVTYKDRIIPAFEFGSLGHCFLIEGYDHRRSKIPDNWDHKKVNHGMINCLLDSRNVSLEEFANSNGIIIFKYIILDDFILPEEGVQVTVPKGFRVYPILWVPDFSDDGVSVSAVIITDLDLYKLAKRHKVGTSWTTGFDRADVIRYGKHILVKRVAFDPNV